MEKIPSTYYHKLWFSIVERPIWGAAGWSLLIGVIAGIQLMEYLPVNLNLILGFIIFPIIWEIKKPNEHSWRFAWGAWVSLSLYAYLHMQIFFFLGVGMCLFWLVESRMGKVGFLPLIWLGLISPVTQYVVSAFSFPIRLAFSQWVVKSFQLLGIDISVSGNVFLWDGYEFAVDPVCMGLNSLITAWIVVTLFIALQQQKTKKNPPIWALAIIYVLTGLLSLMSNFFRIICLVLFQSMPETFSHELIGLICLGMYVILPMYVIVLFAFKKLSFDDPQQREHTSCFRLSSDTSKKIQGYIWKRRVVSASFFLCISFLVWNKSTFQKEITQGRVVEAKIEGLQMEVLQTGIVKYYAKDLLVYIKPPARFWGVSHSPEICWEGSGYTFAHIWETEVCGQKIYMGKLAQGEDELFTAWWYENGTIRTNKQWDWRRKTAQGQAPFSLVNLAATSEEKLLMYCEEWVDKD